MGSVFSLVQLLTLQALGLSCAQPPAPKAVGVLAVVGRPNVGKSTLVNRILGRRAAVVEDTPGVTRDRVSYDAEWSGTEFKLVDTGGWEADVEGIESAIASQAQIAVQLSDAVILVVDGHVGLTDTDERIVKMLRASGKPVTLAVNKVDDGASEYLTAEFWKLGMGEPYGISAMHGRGVGDLLDAALDSLRKADKTSGFLTPTHLRRVALVGRPNVGKYLAGTTRDPVDETIDIDGEDWLFIDTAGIKRRLHKVSGADYYSSLRTQAAIERSELALVLFDSSQPISDQDLKVMSQAVDAGREDRMAHEPPRRRDAQRAGILGQAHSHRASQRLPRPDPGRAPASAARRQAATYPVRHAGVHASAALRDLRHRIPGARLPPVP